MKSSAEVTLLAERVKRSTRNSDILDLCDVILHRSTVAYPPPPPTALGLTRREHQNELAKERMRRMRAKRKAERV